MGNELEIALDHANKANAEGQKAIKRYQGQLRETISGYEEQARGRQEVRRLLVLLNARLVLSVEKLRSLGLFLTLLIAASVDLMLNCLMLALLSTRCKSSIPRPCMISVVLNP